jgi:hypothetical protein
MITTLAIGALGVLTAFQATDTTFAARGATALELENSGGQVVIRTWDRDEVRIQADHSRRTMIEIDQGDRVISIEPEGTMGPATVVDFQLSVPRNMTVRIEGLYTDVDAEGMAGDIEVETMQGTILIRQASGDIQVEAVNGEIRIEGASGRIEATSVSQPVWISDADGEIMVESVSGSIRLANIRSNRVDAGTVSGRITYEGAIQDGGRYFFGAHAGQIVLALPDGVNARISAVSLTGDFVGRYPGTPETIDARRREPFTLGSGSAEIEIETFSGSIVIRRQGDPETEAELAWKEHGGHHGIQALGTEVAMDLSWLGPMLQGITDQSIQIGLDAADWGFHSRGVWEFDTEQWEQLHQKDLQEMHLDLEEMGLDMEELRLQLESMDLDMDEVHLDMDELHELGPEISRILEKALKVKTKHKN